MKKSVMSAGGSGEIRGASLRIGLVREGVEPRDVGEVDPVAEGDVLADQSSRDGSLRDVDDVVAESAAVRPALQILAQHAEAAELGLRRYRNRQVDAKHLDELRP